MTAAVPPVAETGFARELDAGTFGPYPSHGRSRHMATLKKAGRVRSNGRARSARRTDDFRRRFITKTNRHLVEPATASEIMKAVGLRPKDIAELERLIAKYAPLKTTPARRR